MEGRHEMEDAADSDSSGFTDIDLDNDATATVDADDAPVLPQPTTSTSLRTRCDKNWISLALLENCVKNSTLNWHFKTAFSTNKLA